MADGRFAIRFGADSPVGVEVCFEPAGMCYELSGEDYVTASLDEAQVRALEVVYWPGGRSISVHGEFATFDRNGTKLHDLWGG
jgi:hypothetical protein